MNYLKIPIFMFVVIAIHEASRIFSAKLFGIKGVRLSIGAWVPIITILKGNTEIVIKLIPVIGSTKFNKQEYNNLKLWKKCIIELSGYAMNVIALIIPLLMYPSLLERYTGIMRRFSSFFVTGNIDELDYVQSVFLNQSGASPYLDPPTDFIIFAVLLTANLLYNTLPVPINDLGRFTICIIGYYKLKLSVILRKKL